VQRAEVGVDDLDDLDEFVGGAAADLVRDVVLAEVAGVLSRISSMMSVMLMGCS
jgi:hypothetical protein